MKYTPKELKENYNISMESPLKAFFILFFGLFAIVISIYIVLGFAVDLIVPHVPQKVEEKIGALFVQNFSSTYFKEPEAELQSLLDKLLQHLPEKEIFYKVHIVPSSKANALASPGGHIIVLSKLIEEAETENEIAFVLAHELGHYAHRDHLRGLGRKLVLVMISFTLLGNESPVTTFFMKSLINVDRKFSQKQEKKADLYGLDLLNKYYGHVGGSKGFLKRLKEKKNGESAWEEYFSTHPHPEKRIRAIEHRIMDQGYKIKAQIPKSKVLHIKTGKKLPKTSNTKM